MGKLHKESDLAAVRAAKEAAEARIKELELQNKRKDELLMQMNEDMVAFMDYTIGRLEGGGV